MRKKLKYDPKTEEVLGNDPPTGKTDAIAMQHNVDFSLCKDDEKCKKIADIKVIKGLYDSPHNERHWGRWLARNMINSKQKPELGVKMSKMGKAIKR